MATGNKKAGGEATEDKLRNLIRETFGDLMDEREKTSSKKTETREQQWLRAAIREELDGIFQEFVKGWEAEGGEKGKPGEKGGEGEEGDLEESNVFSIRGLLGGGRS